MRRELFQPTSEGEGRLLLLIDAFTGPTKSLEGRTKLAKLDFFLRYPKFLNRALELRAPDNVNARVEDALGDSIEQRMVRYRYGPWDPAYFALLGSLIGRGLVMPVGLPAGVGYRVTDLGAEVASRLRRSPDWADTSWHTTLLRQHLDLSGTGLMRFVYEHFPEVAGASWGDPL